VLQGLGSNHFVCLQYRKTIQNRCQKCWPFWINILSTPAPVANLARICFIDRADGILAHPGKTWAPRRLQAMQEYFQDATRTSQDAPMKHLDASKEAKIASRSVSSHLSTVRKFCFPCLLQSFAGLMISWLSLASKTP